MTDQHSISSDKQTERVKEWLSEVDNDRETIRRKSRDARTVSTWSSIAFSEHSNFKTAYVGQPSGMEYENVKEARDKDCHVVNYIEVEPISTAEGSRRTSLSIHSQTPISSSIESQRNKTLSRLTGTPASPSTRLRSQTASQEYTGSQTSVSYHPSYRASKYVTSQISSRDFPNQREASIETKPWLSRVIKASESSTSQRLTLNDGEILLLYQDEQDKVRLSLEDKHESAAKSTSRQKPGPATVTRNGKGKLQFERSTSGSNHAVAGKKSHRRRLAEYIVGNY